MVTWDSIRKRITLYHLGAAILEKSADWASAENIRMDKIAQDIAGYTYGTAEVAKSKFLWKI